jgi:hypothetical protein
VDSTDKEAKATKYVSQTVKSEIYKIEDRKIEAFLREEKRRLKNENLSEEKGVPPEHDRHNVRKGKIFATEEE